MKYNKIIGRVVVAVLALIVAIAITIEELNAWGGTGTLSIGNSIGAGFETGWLVLLIGIAIEGIIESVIEKNWKKFGIAIAIDAGVFVVGIIAFNLLREYLNSVEPCYLEGCWQGTYNPLNK